MCLSNLLVGMCVPCVLAALAEVRRRQLEPLKMELEMVVIHHVVQGNKPACSARAAVSALDC